MPTAVFSMDPELQRDVLTVQLLASHKRCSATQATGAVANSFWGLKGRYPAVFLQCGIKAIRIDFALLWLLAVEKAARSLTQNQEWAIAISSLIGVKETITTSWVFGPHGIQNMGVGH